MKGNFHVQFLGEGVAATSPPYPTPGWATTQVYPARITRAASDIRRLFAEKSLTGLILPTFSWKILNYGRVLNNVRNQDARLQEVVPSFPTPKPS